MNANCQPFIAQKHSKAFQLSQQALNRTIKKQTHAKSHNQTISLERVIFSDILVHSLHVSVQEYQKKMKMFQKKVTKKKHLESLSPPELQYMNLYSPSVKRLSCFRKITNKFDREQNKKRL